jgi:hypothetical protein
MRGRPHHQPCTRSTQPRLGNRCTQQSRLLSQMLGLSCRSTRGRHTAAQAGTACTLEQSKPLVWALHPQTGYGSGTVSRHCGSCTQSMWHVHVGLARGSGTHPRLSSVGGCAKNGLVGNSSTHCRSWLHTVLVLVSPSTAATPCWQGLQHQLPRLASSAQVFSSCTSGHQSHGMERADLVVLVLVLGEHTVYQFRERTT